MLARMTRRGRILLAMLACWIALPLYSLWQVQRVEQAVPPIGGFLSVDGHSLHYTDTGQSDDDTRPVLLLIHGASTNLLDFQSSLVPALQNDFRVISIDRPGHGYSDRRDEGWPDPSRQAALLHQALRSLGVSQSLWIGHSWAGAVVLAGALDYPESIIGAVSIAGVSHPWLGNASWHAELSRLPLLGAIFRWMFIVPGGQASLPGVVRSVLAPESVPEGYIESTGLALSLRPGNYAHNAEDLVRLGRWIQDQATAYAGLQRPLLLITGQQDHVVPPWNHAHRLLRQAPQAQLASLAGAGHAPHHTRTDEVVTAIRSFAFSVLPAKAQR